MDITSLVATVLTSAAVSGTVAFLLKSYFKTRIEHHFRIELEKYKSELATKINVEHGITTRRLEAYPKIVELVYRTRNMSRDLVIQISPANLSLIEELSSRVKELEDYLYRFRIDLERDGLFTNIHKYKNVMMNFSMKISDIKFFLEHKEEQRVHNTKKDLSSIYLVIEESHKEIIHNLSQHDDNHGNSIVNQNRLNTE